MTAEPSILKASDWRTGLPTLTARLVTLREPLAKDVGPLVTLLSVADATRFGMEDQTELAVQGLVERAVRDRAAGLSFTYVITTGTARPPIGLIQVRRLDPSFEVGEWECTLLPSARGTGVFSESVRLIGSFAFGSVGVQAARNARPASERPR